MDNKSNVNKPCDSSEISNVSIKNTDSCFYINVYGNNLTNDTLRLGMISANGSSRLLIDYKEKHPEAYIEILKLLFDKDSGIGLTHLKIEMGADVDSSSGAEPATKRYINETANVTRGAGFQLAADVKRLYPYVSLDLLQWGEPLWAHESFENRYRWYKETLDAAFDTYGLKFDYISACPNESCFSDEVYENNISWIKYFSRTLKSDKSGRYDFSSVKIVAADEIGFLRLSSSMLNDEELRNAVDIIGLHYSTWSDDAARKLKEKYNKKVWYSEGAAVMHNPELAVNANIISNIDYSAKSSGGISGTNGALEIALRILNMYPQGCMTMYEFQPAVAAYYSGAAYTPKQLICADTPWSGYYKSEVGMAVVAHFTEFLTSGMRYVKNACFGDGVKNDDTGDGHGLVKTTNNYITFADKSTNDFTIIFVNDSQKSRHYKVNLSNLNIKDKTLFVWTTSGSKPDGWLRKTGKLDIENGEFKVTIKPYSIVTLTTLCKYNTFLDFRMSDYQDTARNTELTLPYYDRYDYSESFLSRRGGAPLYHTDICGAFEAQKGMLTQKIKYKDRPFCWGAHLNERFDCDPFTVIGSEMWSNYIVSIDGLFDKNAPDDLNNYIGIGARYSTTQSRGYSLKIYPDGVWQALKNSDILKQGKLSGLNKDLLHRLSVKAVGSTVSFYLDKNLLYSLNDNCAYTSGRVTILSAYANNSFTNLSVNKSTNHCFVKKTDALSDKIVYSGLWELRAGESYFYRNRTFAVSKSKYDSLEFSFIGVGISIVSGKGKEADILIELDGKILCECYKISSTDFRQSPLTLSGLDDGKHTLKITVLNGSFTVDTIEVS